MDISLALGGGGLRGVAHIGVLRALEKHGFKVKAIAGTSAGGLVGAVYAAGYSTEEIENTFFEFNRNRSFIRQPSEQPSLLGLTSITNILSGLLADRTFNDLAIPFTATAVSLNSGKEIILRKGKVIDAVLATIAVPGVFPSKEIDGKKLIDGGVLDPVPVQVARWMRPDLPVIAVTLHKTPDNWSGEESALPIPIPGPSQITDRLAKLRPVQALRIFTQSIEVATKQLSELTMKLYKPEVIISPPVGHIGLLQKINSDEMIKAGINATEETLTEIKAQTNWMKRMRRKVRNQVIPEKPPEFWENLNE